MTTQPECPYCGCEHLHVDPTRPPTWTHPDRGCDEQPSRKRTTYLCDHCQRRFAIVSEEFLPAAVPYIPPRCPACRVTLKTETTRAPVRYHKCHNCGYRVKSIEKQ